MKSCSIPIVPLQWLKITLPVSMVCGLLSIAINLAAQPNVPIDPKYQNEQWDAWWITHPEASLYNYEVLNFRKTFDLEQLPTSFWVHASADNRYELFVNGKRVCRGPARGDFLNWFYETVDLAPYLKTGTNCIAALVWNGGEYKPMAQISDKTAFILQGNADHAQVVNTDESWRVLLNPAYSPIIYLDNDIRLHWEYYVAGVLDAIDAREYPWNWETPGYDDRDWDTPRQLDRPYPAGRSYHHKWGMTPRVVPLLQEQSHKVDQIVRIRPALPGIKSRAPKLPLHIPANTQVEVLFDYGEVAHGYPEVLVSGGKGSQMKIRYAEKFILPGRESGHRDVIQDKLIGIHDEYTSDGGSERQFRPLWTRTFRWLQLEIQTEDEGLTINDVAYASVNYPTRITASFSSDDPVLEKIWDASIRTQVLSAQETFVSDLYWEQIQYVGDTNVQGLCYLFLTGDDTLYKLALKQIDDSRLPSGLTQSRYPCNLVQLGPSYSLSWVTMLYDYWMYGEDPEYIFQFLPGAEQVLEWHARNLTENGLLPSLGFIDWAFIPRVEQIRELGENTESTVHSLFLAFTLKQASELFRAAGMQYQADRYMDWYRQLIQTIRSRCFDPEKALYVDVPGTDLVSQHTNVMAVLADASTGREATALLDRVLNDETLLWADMYFKYYLGRALRKSGMGGHYLDTIEPWRQAIDMGMTSFGEAMTEPRSECHAWSTSPAFEFLSTICGIESLAPGFASIQIKPELNGLEHVEGKMKHPDGMISVELWREDQRLKGQVSTPPGVPAEFIHGAQSIPLKGGVQEIDLPWEGS